MSEYVELQNDVFCIENHIRPLKAISSYKADDLQTIAEKLEIDLESSSGCQWGLAYVDSDQVTIFR